MRALQPRLARIAALAAAQLMLAGCGGDNPDPVAIDAMGEVVGLVYFDLDGDAAPTAALDGPMRGVRISLLRGEGGAAVASDTTATDGTFWLRSVPVGSYRVVVDPAALGDSLRIAQQDSVRITVAANDTSLVIIGLGTHRVTLAGARALPQDRLVSVDGVVLNPWELFGDSTLHLADGSGALRLTRVRPVSAAIGDSVRVVGRMARVNGQATITDPQMYRLGSNAAVAPRAVDAKTAAGADGGKLDAALVRIQGATLVDARSGAAGTRLLVTDASGGTLEVFLAPGARISSDLPALPGAIVSATGLLVPMGGDTAQWRLKPRGGADFSLSYPAVTLREARALNGKPVMVTAVALHGSLAFGDQTLHLADASGAIRAVAVSGSPVSEGDSVRLYAQVRLSEGQAVLAMIRLELLGRGQVPPPVALRTGEAASAKGGTLDAALVALASTRVTAVGSNGFGETVLTLDDGSGALLVLLDRESGAGGTYAAGDLVEARGVLVPGGAGRPWVLKPRAAADLVKR